MDTGNTGDNQKHYLRLAGLDDGQHTVHSGGELPSVPAQGDGQDTVLGSSSNDTAKPDHDTMVKHTGVVVSAVKDILTTTEITKDVTMDVLNEDTVEQIQLQIHLNKYWGVSAGLD